MKRLTNVLKAGAAVLAAGLLFFSCAPFTHDDYGTLVVALPGGAPAAQAGYRGAVSDTFTATLTYSIACTGPGASVSRTALPGGSVSIPLNPGDWAVTVTALNAGGQSIGSGTAPAVIESGKTTRVPITVSIDTSGCDITWFAITSPVYAAGEIEIEGTKVTVHVIEGTDFNGAYTFTAVHTGVSIYPEPGTPLDFSYDYLSPIEVTAENGDTKTWTVTVIDDIPPPPPNTGTWPGNSILARYGLSGLTQPAGTTVSSVYEISGTLAVYLANADPADYNSLVDQIQTITGETGEESGMPDTGMYVYGFEYGTSFELSIIYDQNGGAYSAGTLIVTVYDNSATGSYTWPEDSRWASFNLSGLTQPDGTVIAEVSEMISPYDMVSVTLNNVGDTAYEDLYDQIYTKLDVNPSSNSGETERQAVFMITSPTSSDTLFMVMLSMDTGADEITLIATYEF